jgi:DNA-directed RNA polymerase subunit L
MTTKFYKANHPYLMKIALIEKTSSKITPLQIIKEDLSNQTREVSSNFRR